MSRRKSRPARKPLSERARLDIPDDLKEEGFSYSIFNDVPGRLESLREDGWEFVKKRGVKESESDSLDSNLSFYVGVGTDGRPLRAYAMKIDSKWRAEDYAEEQKMADQVDDAIKAGVEGVPNAYTPGQAAPTVTESPVTLRRG